MENKTWTCDVYCPEQFNQALWPEKFNEFFAEDSPGPWSFDKLWQLQGTVPIYLAVFTFPLMNFKSPTFFTKFNVLGTISVLYLIVFTTSKLVECGFNISFDPASKNYAQIANWRFPALTGTLTLSYFIHNAVLTILRSQKKPENNARDLSIGFFLACFCYVSIGFMFYAAFPVQRSCISDNFLNNFGSGDVLSSTARLFLLFQMITVLPLLMFLVRSQISYYVYGKTWPSFTVVLVLNVTIITIAVLVAMFYPHVGSLLRYVGAVSGLVYVFALPCLVYLRRCKLLTGQVSKTQTYVHYGIIALGAANLVAQFVI